MKAAIEAGKVAAETIQEIGEALSEVAQSLSKSLSELTEENAETPYEKVLVETRAQLTSLSPEEANAKLQEVHNLLEQGKLEEVLKRAENGDEVAKEALIQLAMRSIRCRHRPDLCMTEGGGGGGVGGGGGRFTLWDVLKAIGIMMAGEDKGEKEEKKQPNRDSQTISTPKNPQIDPGGDGDEPDIHEIKNNQNKGSAKSKSPSGGSPSLKSDPYHPDVVSSRIRPPYRPNPAHDPKSSNFNPRKTPEPSDAKYVYEGAIRTKMHQWIGRSNNGQYYQFYSDNAGGVHFSGTIPRSRVPNDVLRQLNK